MGILNRLEGLTQCLRLPNENTCTFIKRLVVDIDASLTDDDWNNLDMKLKSYINNVIIYIRRNKNEN